MANSFRTVAVITPTIGSTAILKCVESVAYQDYPGITHYVVVDGEQYYEKVVAQIGDYLQTIKLVVLPENTGGNGYHGHRIYGALPFLVNTDYVCFLDEDNYIEPYHVSSLMQTVSNYELDWAYALRKIVDENDNFICNDDCDSLGIWGQWFSELHHIDMNCYMVKRELAIEGASMFNQKGYSQEETDTDKLFGRWLLSNYPKGYTSGAYTVNYRVDASDQLRIGYFIRGNQVMQKKYRYFPWRKNRLFGINPDVGMRKILVEDELELGAPIWTPAVS